MQDYQLSIEDGIVSIVRREGSADKLLPREKRDRKLLAVAQKLLAEAADKAAKEKVVERG